MISIKEFARELGIVMRMKYLVKLSLLYAAWRGCELRNRLFLYKIKFLAKCKSEFTTKLYLEHETPPFG